MGKISETVKHLIIINVLVYFGSQAIFKGAAEQMLAIHLPFTENFRPYQIVTHMFMHSTHNFNHILFNMFGLYMFGSAMEYRLGKKKFLTLYLVAGFGAMLLQMGVWYLTTPVAYQALPSAVGASGAIFGLLVGYAMYFPENRIMLLIPPIPIKAKYFVLGYGAIELFSGISGAQDGVGHFAHVGGAIAGFLLIYYWRKTGQSY